MLELLCCPSLVEWKAKGLPCSLSKLILIFPSRPFRRLDSNGDLQWDKINKLEKGQVYKQVGNVDIRWSVFLRKQGNTYMRYDFNALIFERD